MTKLRFRNKDERELVKWARELGWEVTGRNGRNHLDLQHKETGSRTRMPSKFKGCHIRQAAKSQLIAAASVEPTTHAARSGYSDLGDGRPGRGRKAAGEADPVLAQAPGSADRPGLASHVLPAFPEAE